MSFAHHEFEAQAAKAPSAIALVFGDQTMTYQELDRRANALAVRLRAAGVKPDMPIGLCVDRSLELVVGWLAIMKAGGAVLPLDAGYPIDRLTFMVEDSQVRIIVAGNRAEVPPFTNIEIIEVNGPVGDGKLPRVELSPENIAYVIYTSGSTGRPKGVMVPHRGLINLSDVQNATFGLSSEDRVLQFASISFDGAAWEILMALRNGATLVNVPRPQLMPGAELQRTLRDNKITAVAFPPSVLAVLPPEDLPELKRLTSAGEALSTELHRMWSPGRIMANSYGPTEATVCATMTNNIIREGRVSIGEAIANAAVYLLDDDMKQVAPGETGEIYISSIGLARGYLRRPSLTAERFVPDPFSKTPGARLYRTGDVARYLGDGSLEFIGRADNQVKVRGYRIEMGEIESVLRQHPGIRDVAVAVREDANGAKNLMAFVILSDASVKIETVRAFLAERVPDYMVPTFSPVESFPLTPNNKVDRKVLLALPMPVLSIAAGEQPRNKSEELVAKVFADVLGQEVPDINIDFFTIGGDSLKAATVANTLQAILKDTVYVVAVFDNPTIKGLTQNLEDNYPEAMARATGRAGAATVRKQVIAEGTPMTPAHVLQLRDMVAALSTREAGPTKRTRLPRAVFVLSPPRAGSTLFRMMLAGNPALFAPQEVGLLAFEQLGDKKPLSNGVEWMPEGIVRAMMEIKSWTVEQAKAYLNECEQKGMSTHELYGILQSWVAPKLWVDKTTIHALDAKILKRMEASFTEPFYIHLLRHPSGMIRSFQKVRMEQFFFRWKDKPPFSARQLAELVYELCEENILSFLSKIPAKRQFKVRYEDVVKDPEGQMKALCEKIGIPYDAEMIRPHDNAETKMADGIYKDAASKQVGDPNFHLHSAIDASVADAWKKEDSDASLGEMTKQTARLLGYT